jgi:GxxExxY protein
MLRQNAVSKVILDSAFRIHSALGPGLLEHVYEVGLSYELRKQNLELARQVPIPIVYDGVEFEEGYRADLIVERSIIVAAEVSRSTAASSLEAAFYPVKTKGLSPWSID